MKEFLKNRENYIIKRGISSGKNLYNSKDKINAFLCSSENKKNEINSSVLFLSENFEDVEVSISKMLDSLKNSISHLISTVSHIGKIKASYPATSSSMDISLLNLTKGSCIDMIYSDTDSGLILKSVVTTTFLEE